MSERFFVSEALTEGPLDLTGPEAHHLAHVSRLRPGDTVRLFNGDGYEYPARVVTVARRAVALEVLGRERPERELPIHLEVAAPLPKGDRAQFLIEKLTELGVSTFIPLACQRSIVQPRQGRLDKLQRYVIEASKQCGRNVLMEVQPPQDWAVYCRSGDPEGRRILAHPVSLGRGGTAPPFPGAPQTSHSLPLERGSNCVRLAVGPEGGLTSEEVDEAVRAGWELLDLGVRILRIETAALALTVLFGRRDWFPGPTTSAIAAR